jgi:hypothetical protein
MLVKSERFAYRAPDLVASNRIADRSCTHGHAQPRVATVIRQVVDSEECVADAAAGLACFLEVCRGAELLCRLEP